MSAVHLRRDGRPACGCHRRWGSSVITTTATVAKVTCRRCLGMRPTLVAAETRFRTLTGRDITESPA